MPDAESTILYIEDDEPLARLVQRRLARVGCRVDIALDATLGVEMAEARVYDLVLVDYLLPPTDGLSVIRSLRKRQRCPPVVIVSGVESFSVAVEAVRLGAADYLFKDFGGQFIDIIPSTLARILAAQALQREKEAVEQRLRDSEVRYRRLVEEARAVSWEYDCEADRFTYVSNYGEHLLGYPPDRWREPGFRSAVIHVDDLAVAEAFYRDSTRTGGDRRQEYRMRRADGNTVWVQDLVSGYGGDRAGDPRAGGPEAAQEEPSGGVATGAGPGQLLHGIMIDITARKQAEWALSRAKAEAETANNAKSRFLASMNQVIRTPLNTVIGFAELLKGDDDTLPDADRLAEYAGYIRQGAYQLLEIVSDVFDLAQIESGALDIRPTMIDVPHLINSVVTLLKESAMLNDVTVSVAIATTTPLLWADERAAKQVLFHLLANAIKFSQPGGAVVVRARANLNGAVVITVSDNGIGMSEDLLRKLQKPLEYLLQRDVGPSAAPGSGLGLSLVRGLVRLHHGSFRLDSFLREGTTATVEFPAPSQTMEYKVYRM